MPRILPFLVLLAACGPSTEATPDAGPAVTCRSDPRVTAYAPGLEQVSRDGKAKLVLESSDPAPPVRGSNTWVVRALDADGKPLDGLTLGVNPTMPDHGHGTSITATITPKGDGRYEVAPLYLFMPGIWQVTFGFRLPDTTHEALTFTLCIEG